MTTWNLKMPVAGVRIIVPPSTLAKGCQRSTEVPAAVLAVVAKNLSSAKQGSSYFFFSSEEAEIKNRLSFPTSEEEKEKTFFLPFISFSPKKRIRLLFFHNFDSPLPSHSLPPYISLCLLLSPPPYPFPFSPLSLPSLSLSPCRPRSELFLVLRLQN